MWIVSHLLNYVRSHCPVIILIAEAVVGYCTWTAVPIFYDFYLSHVVSIQLLNEHLLSPMQEIVFSVMLCYGTKKLSSQALTASAIAAVVQRSSCYGCVHAPKKCSAGFCTYQNSGLIDKGWPDIHSAY